MEVSSNLAPAFFRRYVLTESARCGYRGAHQSSPMVDAWPAGRP
jgi:hypothetical protein